MCQTSNSLSTIANCVICLNVSDLANQTMTALQTEGLTKRYGSLVAVDHLTLEVYEGEIFGFLGPNGAGKTTSINLMCGLLKPDSGQVFIRGKPIAGPAAQARAKVGVCPQDIILWERLTCLEQLQFVGEMYGLTRQEARRNGKQLLDLMELSEKQDQLARTLSGGMRRRLNLILALVHEPEIVVLDEPEAGLDPQSRMLVRDFIRSLARSKTVILTTHNMDEAERVADRVAILDRGQLLVLDTPGALKRCAGEGDVLEIGVDGSPQGWEERCLEEMITPSEGRMIFDAENGLLTIRVHNAVAKLPGILHLLEAAGYKPRDIRLRENTLEDVFIQLTGRRLRE